MKKSGLRVVLGVTGSIAAYKAPELVRELVRRGCEVRCALTPNAEHFVAALPLATLSRHPVAKSLHDPALWDMAHISWADWADLVLVAPATADMIARLAQGRAEGVIDSLVLSARCRVAVCPAMDEQMWLHRATKDNVARLKKLGYSVWGPEKGELASGKTGWGRLMDVSRIADRAVAR